MRKVSRRRGVVKHQSQLEDKENIEANALSLELVQIHGQLFYAYQNCIGNRMLRAAYLPIRMRWYSFALWAVTILPPAVLITLLFLDWRFAWASPLIQLAITFCLFFPLAKFCIKKGLPNEYTAAGILGDKTLQPSQLHGPWIRLMWFHDLVSRHESISHRHVKMCIELVESINKDCPPSWTSYFRHPLPLLILGIVAYTLNAEISRLLKSAANVELVLTGVGIIAAWLLGLGWMLYSWRYSEAQTRWSFLRSLRWLELMMRP